MSDLLIVLAIALLPAAGNFGGGLLAEFGQTSKIRLNQALHAAAGIVIAIVAVELMPRGLSALPPWPIALSFVSGGVLYLLLEELVERRLAKPGSGSSSGMWMIYIAVSIDLFSDGLMIGAGSAVSSSLAWVLAFGQVLADIPEGYATVANLKDKEIPRKKRLLLSVSFVVPVVLAAGLSYFLLRGQNESLKIAALIFTAGLLTVAAVEDMVGEAHEAREDNKLSIIAFTGGFALFLLVSSYLGSD